MAIAANKFRISIFFLILFQAAGICYRNILSTEIIAHSPISLENAADKNSTDKYSSDSGINGILHSPENLLLPDALLSPIPSFQFGFIIVPACFLFVIFSFYNNPQVKERIFFFTSSYFHTLFLSVILINAP